MNNQRSLTHQTPRLAVAILDDYQNVAMDMADWSPVAERADITVFNDHITDPDVLVDRLSAFDVVFVMRERTPLSRAVIERLPRLKMIASTGPFNASIDMAAAADHGIRVGTTGGTIASTVELTWALILSASRNIVSENLAVRGGAWQTSSAANYPAVSSAYWELATSASKSRGSALHSV